MQARARELEDEISRFCADSANRITVSARNYIMTRVFELVSLCSDMRADAATERGAALALQGQLVDARREIAGLQRQITLELERANAEFRAAGRAYADSVRRTVLTPRSRPAHSGRLAGSPGGQTRLPVSEAHAG
ncbi:hypothetical protein MTO96_042143 [Rhipicephalus appendiculatus]